MDIAFSQNATRWTSLLIGAGAVVIGISVLASWTGPDAPPARSEAWAVLGTTLPLAAMWLAAAIGFGWPLRFWLAPNAEDSLGLQIGMGVAALLTLDAALGSLGVLQLGASLGAWTLTLIGLALLAMQIAHAMRSPRAPLHFPPWILWTAAPAVVLLLVASCSAPGWLWATEFGGYDALSYHLQLPKEWLALGRIVPRDHNVYSYLPGYVEAAYYHLAVLVGDGIHAAYACQMLHALLTLTTAGLAYRFMAGRLRSIAMLSYAAGVTASVAAVMLLGTPWTIVVGSLAYNEMPVLLMLTAGLLAIADARLAAWRCGAIVGLLAAAACGAKLTAVGMAAAPLGIVMLFRIAPRHWPVAIAAGTLAGLIVLMPYLLRNQLAAGNPVFPFASSIFGHGHWSPEQIAIWHNGHTADASASERITALWNQFMRYGIGANPSPPTPWKAQWSILPWLALAGLIAGLLHRSVRWWSMMLSIVLAIQIAFWLCFTHLQSRFLLAAAVPMVLLVSIGCSVILARISNKDDRRLPLALEYLAAVLLVAWSCVAVLLYRSEMNGAPSAAIGQAAFFAGDGLPIAEAHELGTMMFPTIAVNRVLPADAMVLLIGDAAPYYYRGRIVYQTTWDRGPLSRLMREYPEKPEQWAASLRSEGFTHMLVDPTMLAIWERDGWGDPLLTVEHINEFAQREATMLWRYPTGTTLYVLKRSSRSGG